MPPFIKHTLEILPRTVETTRRAWVHLARPVTPPSTAADWQKLTAEAGPLEGPYDWALCLGSMRKPKSGKLTPLGELVDAWRLHDYGPARQTLATLAGELFERVEDDLGFDLITELPTGFESGPHFSLLELVNPDALPPPFWQRHQASSYGAGWEQAPWAEHTLSIIPDVAGRRVLLTTLVHDRPELASFCVHLLRARGATWVGLLALAHDRE